MVDEGTGVVATPAPADAPAIIVEDAQLLFGGDYARRGSDLVLSKDGHDHIISDYFKSAQRKALSSSDGATLSPDLVKALIGEVEVAQAGGAAAGVAQVIGTVSKLTGSATAIRNGVSVMLNVGDAVQKGDVVQAGADSSLNLTFMDGTVFGLSANARMVLNEMVYDPQGSANSSLLSLIQGTITFVAGETAKNGDMRVDTPVATMGIRGTAVLVEIGFEVPGQGSAPPVKFQVLVEPTGRTGSYVILNKNTGAVMGTVNQAGLMTSVTGRGDVAVGTADPLTQMAQAIIQQTLQQYFPNYVPNANPRSNGGGGSTPSDPNSGTSPDPLKFAPPPEPFPGQPLKVPIKLPGSDNNTPPIDIIFTRFNTAPIVAVTPVVVVLPQDQTSFDIGRQVTIIDPDAGDIATPYLPGSARIISATGPSGTPASLNLKSLVTVDPQTGHVTYDPAGFKFLGAGQQAVYVIEFDSQSGPDTTHQTLTFTVDGTNDAPVVTTALAGAAIQGQSVQSFDLLAGASDPDLGETATLSIANVKYSLNGSPAQAGAPSGVTLTGTSLHVDPAAFAYLAEGQTATLVVSYTITDAHGASVTQTETITITGVNDQPIVVSTNFIVTPFDEVTLDASSFTISDPDSSSDFTFTVTNVTGGQFVVDPPPGQFLRFAAFKTPSAPQTITFTMADLQAGRVHFISDGSGPPAFNVQVDDGSHTSNSASVVTPQTAHYDDTNRDPTTSGALTINVHEGDKAHSYDLLEGASDPDHNTLSIDNLKIDGVAVECLPSGLSLNGTQLKVDPSDPAFNYLAAGAELKLVLSYDILDGKGGKTTQTETITITGTNDRPHLGTVSFQLDEGGTTVLKARDIGVSDPDSDSFTFTVSHVEHGKFQVTTDGIDWTDATSFTSAQLKSDHVRFVHDGSESDASFSIEADDGLENGISNTVRARIEIAHVNDAPKMIAAPLVIAEGGTVVLTVLNFLVTDPDDNRFTFHVTDVKHGLFAIWNGECWVSTDSFTTADLKAGRVTFTHDGGEMPPSYEVMADDGHSLNATSNTIDSSVLFIPVNDAPDITCATFTVEKGHSVLLHTSNFAVNDPDSTDFWFTVSNVKGGHFETLNYDFRSHSWEWSTDTSFTTAELEAGRVKFVQQGYDVPSFLIKANDGSWINGTSDTVRGSGTLITNHTPAIDTGHLQASETPQGETVVKELSVSDADFGEHFTFTATAEHGQVHFEDRTSTGTADSLAELNNVLSRGIVYTPPAHGSGQETVVLKITDDHFASDTVNFVFHFGQVAGPVSLTGTTSNDVIVATSAADTLIGAGGRDQFVFGAGTGHDTIKDFRPGNDKIDLQFTLLYEPNDKNFADWLQSHTTTASDGTTVHLDPSGSGDHNTIFLKGVSGVQASDFIVHNHATLLV